MARRRMVTLSESEEATLRRVVAGQTAPAELNSTDIVRLSALRLVMAEGNRIVPTALGLDRVKDSAPAAKGKPH